MVTQQPNGLLPNAEIYYRLGDNIFRRYILLYPRKKANAFSLRYNRIYSFFARYVARLTANNIATLCQFINNVVIKSCKTYGNGYI